MIEERVAVIGAGVMGAGIARAFASLGAVRVFDPVLAPRGLADDVVVAGSLEEAAADATLVIEAVTEDLGVKHTLFQALDGINPTAIVASNSSTFVPADLAKGLSDPGRLLVTHFFNPADIVPLVEVVPGSSTALDTVTRVIEVLRAIGKTPVLLKHEVDGFVANRLQAALVREAMSLIEAGVVSVEDVDSVVIHGLGPRWAAVGPMTTMDLGGLDVWRILADRLFPQLDARTDANPVLRALVADGDLGAKSGRGFYAHTDASVERQRAAITEAFGPAPDPGRSSRPRGRRRPRP